MSLNPWTFAAIIGMALATYACRGGGYWLFRQIKPTPLLRAIMSHIPGTLFVSFVAPALLTGGWPVRIGSVATIVTMATTRNVVVAIFGGTAVAWVAWALL